jgi:hypothetical protein
MTMHRLRLLVLLALASVTSLCAQQPLPSQDSLIEHSLRMFDIPAFEWSGAPEPLRPRLGLYVQEVPFDSLRGIAGVSEGARGFRIWHLMPNWAADLGGLYIGDVILTVDGATITDSIYPAPDEFIGARARDLKAGETMRFVIVRNRAVQTIDVPMIVPTRSPMPLPTADRLGPTRSGTWLQNALAANSLSDWASTIQRQLRVVADQDFSTVQFAGRPSPWRLGVVTYLHNRPTRVGAISRVVSGDIWEHRDELPGLSSAVATAARYLDATAGYASPMRETSFESLRREHERINRLVTEAFRNMVDDRGETSRELARLLDISNDWEAALDAIAGAPERRQARIGEETHLAKLFATADRLDRDALFSAGTAAASLADTVWIDALLRAVTTPRRARRTAEGELLAEWTTAAGRCVVGGAGPNAYSGEYALILDVGGDDRYDLAPARSRTARIVIDGAGDDLYVADSSGQASGIGGVDVLIDRRGDDIYRGTSWSQGSAVLGVGILADLDGDDLYQSRWCSQGAAFHGIGLLYDRAGSDNYIAELYSQAFGYVRGFGALLDESGNDSYRAGWKHTDSRVPNRAHLSLSQGFGYGMRPWSTGVGGDGGIGVLSDRAGDDLYAGDFFSQGSSYWYALGVLHDWQGADRYTAGQYSQGSGIHLSFGALLDDAGDDMYDAYAGLEQGNAHDWSAGCLEDWQGNDTYRGSTSSQGSALTVSFAWLLDSRGDDQYFAAPTDTTHSQGGGTVARLRGGGSLGMLIDLGKGSDHYVEPRVAPGTIVVKSNRGIIYDDGKQ